MFDLDDLQGPGISDNVVVQPIQYVVALYRLQSLRYEGIVFMRSQMKHHFKAPDLEGCSHASRDFCSPAKHR